MTWFGKVVGSAFGFLMGGPIGAMLGAALGHQLDRKVGDMGLLEADVSPSVRQRVQMAFFTATFSVMGHVAKADGRVTESEIEAARNVMQRMELSEDMRRTAIRLYNEGKKPGFALDATLEQFHAECERRYSLLRVFVEIQLEAALADGALRGAEEQVLLRVCERLKFSRFEFYAIRARMEAERRFAPGGGPQWGRRDLQAPGEPSLADAYAVLGTSTSASASEVKRAYRKLMSQHHPDKLVAKGMPESMVLLANEKTQQIRKAYEIIAKARKL